MKREILTGFCGFLGLFCAVQAIGNAVPNQKMILIAHRGGVVDKDG
jgi:hypothetical protein